jgi:GNAT superfamily N-acetyltransferase
MRAAALCPISFLCGHVSVITVADKMNICIRQAKLEDASTVSNILTEAARWLEETERVMWRDGELTAASISVDVGAGLFYLVEADGEFAGTVKFQLEDKLFWPDVNQAESAFIHRLAIRRKFAGRGISTAIFQWAIECARRLERRFLRLDCEALRPRLRAIYENAGFRHHSDRQVGPYFVSRYEYDLR